MNVLLETPGNSTSISYFFGTLNRSRHILQLCAIVQPDKKYVNSRTIEGETKESVCNQIKRDYHIKTKRNERQNIPSGRNGTYNPSTQEPRSDK